MCYVGFVESGPSSRHTERAEAVGEIAVKNLLKAVVGLLLIFVVHIPRLLFFGLLVSYAAVFNNR